MYNPIGIEKLAKENNKPDYSSFYKYMSNNKDIENMGTFTFSNCLLSINSLNKAEKIELNNELNEMKPPLVEGMEVNMNMEDRSVNSLIIDEGINNIIKIPIVNGTSLKPKDFYKKDKKIRNVLLGAMYEKYFKIGDLISLKTNKTEQFRILGFIKKDTYFYNNGGDITSGLNNLNNVIVIPINKAEEANEQILATRIQNGILVRVKNDVNFQSASSAIDLKAKELLISSHNEKLNSVLKDAVNYLINANLPKVVIGICFCVFSSVGLITSLIIMIFNKKRDIGIRLVCGASIFNIFSNIALEVFFISIISFVGSIAEYLVENKGSIQLITKHYEYLTIINFWGAIDLLTLIQLFIIVFVMLIIILVIMLEQLGKLQPKDLIGGME